MTEMRGVIADTESGKRVTFGFNPEAFQDSKSTEYALVSIPGMNDPRVQYVGGNERTLQFTVQIHYGQTQDVEAAIKDLRSMLYAEYSGGRLRRAPHRLIVSFGDTWREEKWVMRSCNILRRQFSKDLKCTLAEVQIELLQYAGEVSR